MSEYDRSKDPEIFYIEKIKEFNDALDSGNIENISSEKFNEWQKAFCMKLPYREHIVIKDIVRSLTLNHFMMNKILQENNRKNIIIQYYAIFLTIVVISLMLVDILQK